MSAALKLTTWEALGTLSVAPKSEPAANDNAFQPLDDARENSRLGIFVFAHTSLPACEPANDGFAAGKSEAPRRIASEPGITGKEEDVEVGLQYFGKRYLNPLLGRWISADPLNVHAGGGDWNLYAYVSGRVISNVDPLGLEQKDVIVVNTAPEGVSEGSYFFQADEGSGTQSFNSRAELETAAGQAGVAVFKYDPKAEFSLEKAKSIEEAKHMFDFMKEDHGSCSGMAVCGTAEKGQQTMDGELDATDGAAQVGGALSGDGMGQEGGKKDGDPAGGCSSCEGSDLKQAVVVGLKGALEAAGKVAEKVADTLKALKRYGDAVEKINGRWPINARYAGKTHPSGVKFKETGFPEFSRHSKAEAKFEVGDLNADYGHDSGLANAAVGLDRTPDGMVWHHVEDGLTMQLIPREVHDAVRHTGGAAVIRASKTP